MQLSKGVTDKDLTEVEHVGHTYPAGAVCGGKPLIWETKQFVCMTSEMNEHD